MTTIARVSPIDRTPRVMQLEGMFDLKPATESRVLIEDGIPADVLDKEWNVGLIVGPSGSGKSTVANERFGDLVDPKTSWPADQAVIDAFPHDMPMKSVTELMSSVGFSSPPAWLRPFHVLSNGEQFRVSMARHLAEHPELVIVDEFTSVVDRTVAQLGSSAIAKTVRRNGSRFIAVSCHYDIVDWLQPDWIYQPHLGDFSWRHLQPRPGIDLEIFRSDTSAWSLFGAHHYLSSDLNKAARIYVGAVNGSPAVMTAVLPMMHPKYRKARRFSRTVVLPDYQGIGLAGKFTDELAANYKRLQLRVFSTLAHPALIHSRMNNPKWQCYRAPTRSAKQGPYHGGASGRTQAGNLKHATARLVAGFEYIGPESNRLRGIVV